MADTIITLREAEPADVELLVEFNVAHAAEVEDKGLNPDILRQGITHLMDEPRDGFYLLAEVPSADGSDVSSAGTLMVTKEWSDWRNGQFWWIQSVYVHPEFRRQGIYSALHSEVARLAEDAGNCCGLRLYVEKDNTGAQATYRAHNMHETYYLMFEEDWSES